MEVIEESEKDKKKAKIITLCDHKRVELDNIAELVFSTHMRKDFDTEKTTFLDYV